MRENLGCEWESEGGQGEVINDSQTQGLPHLVGGQVDWASQDMPPGFLKWRGRGIATNTHI